MIVAFELTLPTTSRLPDASSFILFEPPVEKYREPPLSVTVQPLIVKLLDAALMLRPGMRKAVMLLLPSVISLETVAEEALEPLPITMLFEPVVVLLPAW